MPEESSPPDGGIDVNPGPVVLRVESFAVADNRVLDDSDANPESPPAPFPAAGAVDTEEDGPANNPANNPL